MADQLTTNAEALKLFFTDDVYLVPDASVNLEKEIPEDITLKEPEVVYEVKKDFTFLGKNRRNILILVNDDQYAVSTEEGRELLRKIVKAINLTADDFAVLNYATYPETNFAELQAFFKPQLFFAFGLSPQTLGMAPQPQHVLIQQGEVNAIFSSELHALEGDLPSKKILWKSLQQLKLS